MNYTTILRAKTVALSIPTKSFLLFARERSCKICAFLLLFSFQFLVANEDTAEKALSAYVEGEKATKVEDRKKAFNEALSIYRTFDVSGASGKVYYDIGNCYFQLGELGLAIFYYYKAAKEMPRDNEVKANLTVALQKAGLPVSESSLMKRFFFFYYDFSPFEKGIWAIGFFLFAFCFFSLHLWLPHAVFKRLGVWTVSAALLLFSCLVWQKSFSYPEAVVIRASPMLRGPGKEYAAIEAPPCIPGTKVEVIGVTGNGDWLKVRALNSNEGYLSKEQARLL